MRESATFVSFSVRVGVVAVAALQRMRLARITQVRVRTTQARRARAARRGSVRGKAEEAQRQCRHVSTVDGLPTSGLFRRAPSACALVDHCSEREIAISYHAKCHGNQLARAL